MPHRVMIIIAAYRLSMTVPSAGAAYKRSLPVSKLVTQGVGTLVVVTSLKKGSPRWLYEQVYCRPGQYENHTKS